MGVTGYRRTARKGARAGDRSEHFVNQVAPGLFCRRQWASSMLLDVAQAAQGLQSVHAIRILPRLALQWRHVIAFQLARTSA